MKTVLVDLDGPLVDFEGRFFEIWKERFPHEVAIPFEARTTFYLIQQYPEHLRPAIEAITNEAGFFASMPPTKGGVEAVREMMASGFEVMICSSGIYKNPTCLDEKKQWIAKYLGDELASTAFFCKDKTMVKGDYLIDDKPDITGRVTPEWTYVLFDQPFNRTVQNVPRIALDWSNWREHIR